MGIAGRFELYIFYKSTGSYSVLQVFKMATVGIMLILYDHVFLSCCTYTHFVILAVRSPPILQLSCRDIWTPITPSSATFMCHLFNKASGQGNSQRGNLAAVLGDVLAGLHR